MSVRVKQWAVVACAIVLGNSMTRSASADETRARFSWVRGDGAGGCPDQRAVEAGVAARLGRNPFADDGTLSIEAFVESSGKTWRADIRVRDQHGGLAGRRAFDTQADDCGPLGEAVVLAVAIVIDPNAATRPPESVAAASPLPPAPTQVAPASAPCPASPPCPVALPCPSCPKAEPARDGVEVLGRAVAIVKILPRAAVGPGLLAAYGRDALQLTASLTWVPDVGTPDGRFAFGIAWGGLGACYRFPLATAAALGACADLELGSVHAAVQDVNQLTPIDVGDHLWFGGGFGPRFSLESGWFRFEAGAQLIVPISGKDFRIRGTNAPILESPAAAGAAYLGIGFGKI